MVQANEKGTLITYINYIMVTLTLLHKVVVDFAGLTKPVVIIIIAMANRISP